MIFLIYAPISTNGIAKRRIGSRKRLVLPKKASGILLSKKRTGKAE